VATAIRFGAKVSSFPTEQCSFEGDRIDAMREMIPAHRSTERNAVAKLCHINGAISSGFIRVLKGLPATIVPRPPLHEFMPHTRLAKVPWQPKLTVPLEHSARRVEELMKVNRVWGTRAGCDWKSSHRHRNASRAIFEAAAG